jgi:DNA-directed RNA polymerase subunit RPC12/RpoP
MAAVAQAVFPCKLCGAPTFERYQLPTYRLLECEACGFRCIPYLDDEAVGGTQAVSDQQYARDVALCRQPA